jgi:diguanylate cyclase
MQQSLLNLHENLSAQATSAEVTDTGRRVEEDLRQWGEQAAGYFKQKAHEVKDLMMVVARMAEAVGDRDQRYASQFNDFSARLQAMADLEDLTKIRASLVENVRELKICVERMAQDSHQSVTQLRSELSVYQARLEATERLAAIDVLTGLENRRKLEALLAERIAMERMFCVISLDLNGFKQVNDQLGHAAGDELLKRFATELKASARAAEITGRWGGDEFLVIVDAELEQAQFQVERIRERVFGAYTVQVGDYRCQAAVSAAVGVAAWRAGDSVTAILERSDAAMYQEKADRRDRDDRCRRISV